MADDIEMEGRSAVVQEASALLDQATDLKDEAYERGEAMLLERAIAEYDDLHRRFGCANPGADLETILALATYNRSGALRSLGRFEEARAGFAELADRYADHSEERLRETGRFSAVRLKLMISIPEPPQYVLDRSEPSAESAEQDADALAHERATAEAMLTSHEQAAAILHKFRGTACPFVLFLRSFELEAFDLATAGEWTAETGLDPHIVSFSATNPSQAERQLAGYFRDEQAAISVANRASRFAAAWVIPRLLLPNEGWQDILGVLIRAASAIVMQVTAFTPGVRWEIEQIRVHGHPSRTLFICGSDDENSVSLKPALERFAGRQLADQPPVSVDDSQLSGFPYVVPWAEVPVAGIATVEPLSQLLPAVHDLLGMDQETRLHLLLDAAYD